MQKSEKRGGGFKLTNFHTNQWDSLVCHIGISREIPSEILWFISISASTSTAESTYSSSHSVSGLKDGDTDPILMQDRSTSQAGNSCADNTDMRWIMLRSGSIERGICGARGVRHLLFINKSHVEVFCMYSWVVD